MPETDRKPNYKKGGSFDREVSRLCQSLISDGDGSIAQMVLDGQIHPKVAQLLYQNQEKLWGFAEGMLKELMAARVVQRQPDLSKEQARIMVDMWRVMGWI